ncbi:hypothetical protein FG05_13346 [Fusarium graminearum]|nr:hypothetical protein FG05_13346 [Fusarium graminearum]
MIKDQHAISMCFVLKTEKRWSLEKMTDSLLTLAATELLGLGCLGRGNDHYAFTYVSEVNSMGPFGVEPSVAIEKAKKVSLDVQSATS